MTVRVYQKETEKKCCTQSFRLYWAPSMYVWEHGGKLDQMPAASHGASTWVGETGHAAKSGPSLHAWRKTLKIAVLAWALPLNDYVARFPPNEREWEFPGSPVIRTLRKLQGAPGSVLGLKTEISHATQRSWKQNEAIVLETQDSGWSSQRFPSPLGLPKVMLSWMAVGSSAGLSHLAAVLGRHWWET